MKTVVCLLVFLLVVLFILIFVISFRRKEGSFFSEFRSKMEVLQSLFSRIESVLREEFKTHREESQKTAQENRKELSGGMKDLQTVLVETLQAIANQNRHTIESFQKSFDQNIQLLNELQREKLDRIQQEQKKLIHSIEKRLDQMRQTVDEKLQKTLNERLSQSFQTVGKQLQAVQEGLGEMRILAQDVGGLKKVLSNVRMWGSFGELQLSMLLEQILAPNQYQANVQTKKGYFGKVEFAIKLPGKDHGMVWIPIDAKFPKDVYEQLQIAYEQGDVVQVETARKNLDMAVKKMAKDINEKYLDPPHTTDFAILFLPFEGLYAEVVKKAGLLEELQRMYKVIVTGPTTLAAILNSLQMGFRTLAIQKCSSEVWQILGEVKREFEDFGDMLEKAQKYLQSASNQLDDVVGRRTRAIQKKLKNIEILDKPDTSRLLPKSSRDAFAEKVTPES
ncbi:MAG: DNA recombination protein RmuC [Flavobacteriales bacterium AspAUS03]